MAQLTRHPRPQAQVGARSGNRTHTPLRAGDFKSPASAVPPSGPTRRSAHTPRLIAAKRPRLGDPRAGVEMKPPRAGRRRAAERNDLLLRSLRVLFRTLRAGARRQHGESNPRPRLGRHRWIDRLPAGTRDPRRKRLVQRPVNVPQGLAKVPLAFSSRVLMFRGVPHSGNWGNTENNGPDA